MRQRGFTLLEVMIGLALLGFALVILIQSAAGSMSTARQSQLFGVVTDLSRGKMYEIEEKLIKDGFTDTDQSEDDKTFEDEGWPQIKYAYKVEQVELPSYDDLQAMAQGRAAKAGSGSGSGSGSAVGSGSGGFGSDDTFANSTLGGMLSQIGGGLGGPQDIDSAKGASFIQGYYDMVQQILKVSIRKVTLTVTYDAAGSEQEMKTVAYYTDAAAMDKIIGGLGSKDLDDEPGGAGGTGTESGSGSGTRPGAGSGSGTRPGGGGGKGSGTR